MTVSPVPAGEKEDKSRANHMQDLGYGEVHMQNSRTREKCDGVGEGEL